MTNINANIINGVHIVKNVEEVKFANIINGVQNVKNVEVLLYVKLLYVKHLPNQNIKIIVLPVLFIYFQMNPMYVITKPNQKMLLTELLKHLRILLGLQTKRF